MGGKPSKPSLVVYGRHEKGTKEIRGRILDMQRYNCDIDRKKYPRGTYKPFIRIWVLGQKGTTDLLWTHDADCKREYVRIHEEYNRAVERRNAAFKNDEANDDEIDEKTPLRAAEGASAPPPPEGFPGAQEEGFTEREGQ